MVTLRRLFTTRRPIAAGVFFLLFFAAPVFDAALKTSAPPALYAQEVLRLHVIVETENIYGGYVDAEYPLTVETARRRALEEAAYLFSGMIYGWAFHYNIGEKARAIEEKLELDPVGSILFGDARLTVTEARREGSRFSVWADYRLNAVQERRTALWRAGTVRSAQGIGQTAMRDSPFGDDAAQEWLVIKKSVIEDAARNVIRAMLRGEERNRPKAADGYIALDGTPRFFLDGGIWKVAARFRVEVREIIGYSVY